MGPARTGRGMVVVVRVLVTVMVLAGALNGLVAVQPLDRKAIPSNTQQAISRASTGWRRLLTGRERMSAGRQQADCGTQPG
ncbi:MAG: hypothetical protein JWO57_81 [Pseudonocardiales bacterium]|nr:hypothetical protein [Pseudonocardiales bacterium]